MRVASRSSRSGDRVLSTVSSYARTEVGLTFAAFAAFRLASALICFSFIDASPRLGDSWVDFSALHDQPHCTHGGDGCSWIAFYRNQVGQQPGFHLPNTVLHVQRLCHD